MRTLPKDVRRHADPDGRDGRRGRGDRLGPPSGPVDRCAGRRALGAASAPVPASAFRPARRASAPQRELRRRRRRRRPSSTPTTTSPRIRTRIGRRAGEAALSPPRHSDRRADRASCRGTSGSCRRSSPEPTGTLALPGPASTKATSVALRVITNPDAAAASHARGCAPAARADRCAVGGVAVRPRPRSGARDGPSARRRDPGVDELAADCRRWPPSMPCSTTPAGCRGTRWPSPTLQRRVAREAQPSRRRALETAADVLAAETRVRLRLAELTAEAARPVVDDAEAHLERLLRRASWSTVGVRRLPDLRATCGRRAPARTARRRPRRSPAGRGRCRWSSAYAARRPGGRRAPRPVEVGWLLEELRVSVFAQSLGTRVPVSATRVADPSTPSSPSRPAPDHPRVSCTGGSAAGKPLCKPSAGTLGWGPPGQSAAASRRGRGAASGPRPARRATGRPTRGSAGSRARCDRTGTRCWRPRPDPAWMPRPVL